MDGFILNYKTSDRKDITDLNTQLFGRVACITRNGNKHYYYYKGQLDSTRYYKLSNGSYFIESDNSFNIPKTEEHKAVLQITDDKLITAKQKFKKKYNDTKVNNLD